MALQLVNKGWDFTRKRKKCVLLLAAFGVTGYGVYRVYNLPSVMRKRRRLFKLLTAFVYLAEAVSDSSETVGIVAKDLSEFLQSDSDEIPNSLKQIAKISCSKEFSDSAVSLTASLTRGLFRGYRAESKSDLGSGFYQQFMDKLFSDSGKGFASVIVGSFAKNLVLAFYSNGESDGQLNSVSKMNVNGPSTSGDGSIPRWVEITSNERCKELMVNFIERLVSTAVSIYLEKTMNINTYDDLFSGMTNPKHEKQVKDMLVAVCNSSIETLIKTSHRVLTNSNSRPKTVSDSSDLSRFVVTRSNSDIISKSFFSEVDDAHGVITVKKQNPYEERENSGLISTMSHTLAVPSNRKLVLDVTGRVTCMTVRSFLEFLLEKTFSAVKQSVSFVNEAVIDRGFRVVRYLTEKTSVVATICLSLCLHIFGDTAWMLMPA